MKYILGLDLGVASIGWAVTEINEKGEPVGLIDANSVIFKPLDNDKGKLYNVERRDKRGSRRILRRKKHRVERTKMLLVNSSFLTNEEIDNLYVGKLDNIYEVRLKGLKEQLSKNEIARLMIYYCKNRGFKSNRKTEDLEILKSLGEKISEKDSDEKKLKPIIAKNTELIESKGLTPIEVIYMIRENDNSILGFKNKEGNYKFGFKRNQVIDEVRKILGTQQILSKEIVDEYIDILSSQRDFSDGPGGDSKYKIDYTKLAGKCKYTGEVRAVKSAPSYEIFTMLQKLNDIRYVKFTSEDKIEKKKLSKEVIHKLYDLVVEKNKTLTYDLIEKSIDEENIKLLNIPKLSKSKYVELRKSYFKERNDNENLTEEEINAFNEKLNNERMKQELIRNNLKAYKELKSKFKKNNIDENRIKELGGIYFLDLVAELLTYSKTDEKLEYFVENVERYSLFKEQRDIVEIIKTFPNYTKNGNLSLILVRELNKLLMEGHDYESSLSSLNYYIDTDVDWEKFPTISEIEDSLSTKITNPNVKHILVILRKLYNTLLFKYGRPEKVHLELSRDFSNDFSTRNKIQKEQLENKVRREVAAFEMYGANKDIVAGKDRLSNDDFVRIKLWEEQNKVCMYSGRTIEKYQLTSAEVQIDHILPYSKSFDNSYSNKVLVFSNENQDKKERTPYQWLKGTEKWNEFKQRVRLNLNISNKKKENLLFEDEVVNNEFLERELHATSYSSRLALNIFQRLIPVSDEDKYDEHGNEKVKYLYNRNVIAFQGKMTSMLRNLYSLNKYTHSFESDTLDIDNKAFILKEFEINKDNLKMTAYNVNTGLEITSETKVEKNKSGEFKTIKDELLKKELDKKENLIEISDYFKDKVLFDLKIVDFEEIDTVEPEIISILYKMITALKEEVYSKNRENHLHHSLDAFLLTIMNRSMQMKLIKYNQLISVLKNKEIEIFNEEKGEYIDSKEFAEELQKQKIIDIDGNERGIKFNVNGKTHRLNLVKPYENFLDDIKNKIFDKRENNKLPYHVVKSKVSGALHAETILGESKGEITKRISVFDINYKNLGKIFDKDGSQKEIYETLVKWLEAKSKDYPKLKNGNIIKKVKIVDGNKDKLIKLGNKRYVEMGRTTVKILVLKKEAEEGLKFASIGRYKYNLLKSEKDVNISIWKDAIHFCKVRYNKLKENGYRLIHELIPGETIELELNKGNISKCLVVGFSGGKIEISSVIGDALDLINDKISTRIKERYYITVSTIKSIKKINKNILGD
ncbi:type II CRISPR RNA-guided endonuclease Cas9 [Streptobacillus moniliformis]|uniref:type II CRISPR RNA-guided endonuclease Cas9 n=1 Tax=Streptobacillus moniliformis TaxID=34105 RepID=UPI0007E41CB6|nr:type II CRISPR RNA-guided endonuclease Cas9 [Streptobacillus moniliformis]